MFTNSFTRPIGYFFPTLISIVSLSLLLIFNEVKAGNNYYISSSTGDDSRTNIQARNPATPWKTITKLNSFFSSLLPGDSVLFKKGEVFSGTITASVSGTSSSPIIISSYGTGARPVITGFQTVTGWTNEGSGIYSKSLTVQSTPNVVFFNGVNQPLGRYPKTTYLTIDSHSGYTTITDAATPSTTNWTGAQIVIRKEHWIWDKCPVTAHSGTTITYTSPNTVAARNGFGFFFQNDLKCLTELGDWAFKSGKFYMYFGANDPATYTVKVSTIDRLVSIPVKNYITIYGLSLQGGNTAGVYSTGTGNTVKNCDISFIGDNGVIGWSGSNNLTVDNCVISQCQNRGFYSIASYPTVKNSTIKNIAMIPGMGGNGSTTYTGICTVQAGVNNTLIENNRVDSIGYNGIAFSASNSIVRNNFVSNYCYVLDDGSGIYTAGNGYTGRKINNNIVINNTGNTASKGTNVAFSSIIGIYLDNNSANIDVYDNTAAFNSASGIYLHGSHEIEVFGNTFYGNGTQIIYAGSSSYDPMRNNNVRKNIFFSPLTTQFVMDHTSNTTDVALVGDVDSNQYCRPLLETNMFKTIVANATSYKTFSQWKTYSSKDQNSILTPFAATEFLFEYAISTSRIIPLTGTWKTLANESVIGSITLQPYTSIVLLKSTENSSNHSPSILNQSLSLTENSSIGTTVGTVIASDPDASQTKTFSIVSGNTNGAFAINASTGVLSVASSAAINYEVTPAFALVVKVQDNGTGNLSSQATISVSLTDANEAPVISNQSFSVAESSANGTTVGIVIASDPDAGQTKTFSIVSGNTNGAFTINASTGVLSVASSAALYNEITPLFVLVVKVQDNGTGILSSQATISVSLTDVNEVPVISNQSFSVAEASTNGTTFGTVVASDPDAGQTKTFSIISGNINGALAINASTGVLSVASSAAINYEVTPAFALVVKVQDNGTGNLSSQATISVSLIDVNEVPVISNQSFTLAETSVNGTTAGTVIASDPDAGQTKTFSIVSGNTSGAFTISSSTGVVTVANAAALNFEVTPSFTLVVKVQDNGTGNLSSQATINVSLIDANEAPVISNQSFSVAETSANGTTVGIVIASDPDASQTKTFTIVSGNTNGAFAINASTGVLSVASSAALNFEVTPTFTLIIKVQDNGPGNLSSQATISVSLSDVNEVPVISNQTFSVAETSTNGTIFGTVVASDPDAGQTKTFSIVSGNTNGAFTINSSTGAVTVANAAALNFEVTPTFALVVKVQDNGTGNLSSQATIIVSLSDVNEVPVISNQLFSISEASVNGTNVGTVISSDPDAGQTKTFSIVSGNINGAFTINSSTGVVTVANAAALNFEVTPTFALIVKVQDNGTGNLNSQATITIVLTYFNEAPAMANQSFSVNEASANGTIVGTVIASDPDAGQTKTFSIDTGNTNGAFIINSSTGVLTVANTTTLDFEVIPAFALGVKVQDNGSGNLSAQAIITILLSDVNEAPVITNQSFLINETPANGTIIGNVVASDPDAGQTLFFLITSGNINNTFAINSSTGVLTVLDSVALKFNINPTFQIGVIVFDNGTGNLYNTAIVSISLSQVSNHPPVINDQSFTVKQNSPTGTSVGIVVAIDPDANQQLEYTILSGNVSGIFTINSYTGELSVADSNSLGIVSNQAFELLIKVQDNGTGILSNQARVTVFVIAENTPPVITNQTLSTIEHQPVGTLVGNIIVNDSESGSPLLFSITSGNSGMGFSINASSGIITINNSSVVCYEANPVFNLSVKVQDVDGLSSEAFITVNVKDINEIPKCVDQKFSITENSSAQTFVGNILANDFDQNQTLTYSIVSGNINNAFSINPNSGILEVNDSATINFEEFNYFELLVSVQDNGDGNLTAFSTITIEVLDVNEAPVMENQALSVIENAAPGTKIGYLKAKDPDKGQAVKYKIANGNDSQTFNLNDSSGLISVADPTKLFYGRNSLFALTVIAEDNGVNPLSTLSIITINLLRDSTEAIQTEDEEIALEDAFSERDISLFPNPTTDIVNVNLEKAIDQQVDIRIYAMTGTEIYSSVTKGEKNIAINMNDEKPGTYVALITINGHKYTKNFIVQN